MTRYSGAAKIREGGCFPPRGLLKLVEIQDFKTILP